MKLFEEIICRFKPTEDMNDSSVQISTGAANGDNCSICWDPIVKYQMCLTDKCRHRFCYNCIFKWTESHNYCPICQQIFEIIIFVNHLRYENDFELFVIQNKETIERQQLESRREELRRRLVISLNRRIQRSEDLRKQLKENENIIEKIEKCVERLDMNANQNNRYFEVILNEVSADIEVYDETVPQVLVNVPGALYHSPTVDTSSTVETESVENIPPQLAAASNLPGTSLVVPINPSIEVSVDEDNSEESSENQPLNGSTTDFI